jgi:hypothetical protein
VFCDASKDYKPQQLFDFDIPRFQVGSVMIAPQLMRINKTGTHLFITVNYGGAAGK